MIELARCAAGAFSVGVAAVLIYSFAVRLVLSLSPLAPRPSRHGYFIWRGGKFVPDTRRLP